MMDCSTLLPPAATTAAVQTVERNHGRLEARVLIGFTASAEAVGFPGVAQAARLTRFVDRTKSEAEFPPAHRLPLAEMLRADRQYWGLENGLHLRRDVTAGEDRSRVRHRRAALNLALIRRASISVAIHWPRCCPNPRQATLRGFYDAMAAKNARRAFSLV